VFGDRLESEVDWGYFETSAGEIRTASASTLLEIAMGYMTERAAWRTSLMEMRQNWVIDQDTASCRWSASTTEQVASGGESPSFAMLIFASYLRNPDG